MAPTSASETWDVTEGDKVIRCVDSVRTDRFHAIEKGAAAGLFAAAAFFKCIGLHWDPVLLPLTERHPTFYKQTNYNCRGY